IESLKWSRLCYAKRNLTVRGARNVRRLTRVASHVSEAFWANSPSKVGLGAVHRRRLVINIGGGKNLGHKYWGAKIWGEFIFRQKILEKFPSILSKIPDGLFFLVIDNFFAKLTLFIQYVLHFLCIVVFVSAFFHVYFLNKQH